MAEIKIDGKKVFYEVTGKGNPVVLIHGWRCTHKTVKIIADYLSENFKVYNIDVVGFGNSEMPDEPMNSDNYGDWLKKLVKALDIKKPIMIGHSHGGRMILNYCYRNLGPCEKIVLIDSAGIKNKRKPKYYIKVYTFKLLKIIFKILPKTEGIRNMNQRAINFFGSDDYRNSPEVLRKSMSIFVNEDFTNNLSKIKTPTLIVWGAKDTQTPLWQGELMNMKIKDSKLAVIDNGDHYSFLRDWNQFTKALDDFLIEK